MRWVAAAFPRRGGVLLLTFPLGLAFFFCSDAFLVLLVLVGAGVIECGALSLWMDGC